MVSYNQSGYIGSSRSVRAAIAESRGLLPLSRITGAPRWALKAAARVVGPAEWHHTGKHAVRTDYYNEEKILAAAAQIRSQFETAAAFAAFIDARRATCAAPAPRPGHLAHRLNCQVWAGNTPTGHTLRQVLRAARAERGGTIRERCAAAAARLALGLEVEN